MFNKLTFLYSEEYKINISLFFLISFLFFQPILKYSEYVLNLPRINFSIIVFLLFFLYIISISNFFLEKFNVDLLFTFWVIVFISGIQILSTPWAIYYGLTGPEQFLKVISKTFFCYWMFWFSGLHIKKVLNLRYTKFFFSTSWVVLVILIFQNALNNEVFSIILEGEGIYLMLGDTFAILSIFTLIYNKKFDLCIIFISIIALFALLSRGSLYSFMIISIFYMLKEHKIKLLLLSLVLFFFIDQLSLLKDDRMLRILFGGFDASQTERMNWYLNGLKELNLTWIFGTFMGDIKSSYGHTGTYIHSYLSFLSQFGIIPFFSFIIIIIFSYIKIAVLWFKNKSRSINFIFYFSTFIMIEILFARSYNHPYIWLSLSSISLLNNEKK